MPERDAQPYAGDPGAARLAREAAHDLGNVAVALRGFAALLARRVEGQAELEELVARVSDCAASLGATTAWLQEIAQGGAAPAGGDAAAGGAAAGGNAP